MTERTREEHVAWCKQMALEYLPHSPSEAFASMASDMNKHPDTEGVTSFVAMSMMIPGLIDDPEKMRRWINGFN